MSLPSLCPRCVVSRRSLFAIISVALAYRFLVDVTYLVTSDRFAVGDDRREDAYRIAGSSSNDGAGEEERALRGLWPRCDEADVLSAWFAQKRHNATREQQFGGSVGPPPSVFRPRLAERVRQYPCYAINGPKKACSASGDEDAEGERPPPTLVLIWVYSAPANVEARARVRGTWGSVRDYEGYVIRVVFFVGSRSPDAFAPDRLLVDENRSHGDIVQDVSYVDSYDNLSLKGASGLRWLSKYCSAGAFAVKVDDDTLVSPFALVHYLRSVGPGREAACKVQVRARPQRKPDRWFEDPLDFPSPLYPSYCQGFAYILPMSVAQRLADAVGRTRVPRMEDVYVTGVLAKAAGVNLVQLPRTAWMVAFPNGYEKAVDSKPNIMFVSDTFIPSRVNYFWQKQKEVYNWTG